MAFLKSLRLVAFAVAATAIASPAFAGEPDQGSTGGGGHPGMPLGVVELFTSQGCNSCPPADEFFADIATRSDVVALAYHVNYWDYLGWQDTLSSEKNTERQYDYMRAFHSRSVYTPQAVINGRTHVNGADRSAVDGALDEMEKTGQGMRVAIKVAHQGDGIVIDAGDAQPGPGALTNAHLIVVYFDPPETVRIGKGENSGRQLTYWNAVSDIQTAGMWHGKAQRYELPTSEVTRTGGSAVLLQSVSTDGLPGPIIGAAFVQRPAMLKSGP
jgi:hypothetical protein